MLVVVSLPSRLPNTFILFFWTSFNTGTDLSGSFGPIRDLIRGQDHPSRDGEAKYFLDTQVQLDDRLSGGQDGVSGDRCGA